MSPQNGPFLPKSQINTFSHPQIQHSEPHRFPNHPLLSPLSLHPPTHVPHRFPPDPRPIHAGNDDVTTPRDVTNWAGNFFSCFCGFGTRVCLFCDKPQCGDDCDVIAHGDVIYLKNFKRLYKSCDIHCTLKMLKLLKSLLEEECTILVILKRFWRFCRFFQLLLVFWTTLFVTDLRVNSSQIKIFSANFPAVNNIGIKPPSTSSLLSCLRQIAIGIKITPTRRHNAKS